MTPTPAEADQIARVRLALVERIESGQPVLLPRFSGAEDPAETALHQVGSEPNPYGGTISGFRYQFEGEEDLLHLIVCRMDGTPTTTEDAQRVAGLLLGHVHPGLVWFKPGRLTQHFYLGHESYVADSTDRL